MKDVTILKILNKLKGEDESRSQSAVNPNSIKLEAGDNENNEDSAVTVGSKQKAREEYEAKQAAEKARIAEEREAAMDAMEDNQDGNANVIYPKYKYNERLKVDIEVDFPPNNLFMPIGHNKKKEDGIKHYRRYYTDELENCREVIPQLPFLHEDITRAEKKSAGLFGTADLDPSSSTVKKTGMFKGLVKVYNK